jgi:tetratricopeptide (TPR) repeat protein
MARTPTRWNRFAAPFAAATALSFAHVGFAEKPIQVAAPKATAAVDNPYLNKELRPTTVAEEPQSSRREPITYQNPFANLSKSPPIDPTLRPGPVSRWQRPILPRESASVLKESPAGSVSTSKRVKLSWDELNPTDPIIRTGPPKIAQPKSVVDGEGAQQPAAGPGTSTSTDAKTVDEVANGTNKQGRVSSAFTLNAPLQTPAEESIPADLVSSVADTPSNWLAQAQQAATSASSIEDLAAVVDLCERGIKGTPKAGELASLRSLAAWAHNRRGELLADDQRADEALKDFQVAIAMDANCSLAIHNRAVTLAQRNQFAAALRDFNRVIELNPGLGVAYRNRAELLAALGRTEEAVADYTRALDSMPEDAAMFRARSHAYQRLGDFAHAATDLTRAIDLAPKDPDGFTQRGNLAAEQGKFEQAQEDFRRAIEIDSNWGDAYRSLAWLQATCPDRKLRNPEEALKRAEQAAKLSLPDDYLVLDTLAAAHAAAGKFEQAVELQQKCVAAAPPQATDSLRQRLSLYERKQPFLTQANNASPVRTASHEAGTKTKGPRKSPAPRQKSR